MHPAAASKTHLTEIFRDIMRNSTLRHYVRAVLNEDYVVTLNAAPTGQGLKRGKKGKKGKDDPEALVDINASFLLSKADLDDIIKTADEKDRFKSDFSAGSMAKLPEEWQEEIAKRLDVIEFRFGNDHAAKIAKSAIKKMSSDELNSILFNMPDEEGAKKDKHPKIGSIYSIPSTLVDLALLKQDARSGAIGKGEALAYLMFGRVKSKGEPDLLVPWGETGRPWDIKFFDTGSSLVDPGAAKQEQSDDDDIDMTADKSNLCLYTRALKSRAEKLGYRGERTNAINRNRMREQVIVPLMMLVERGLIPDEIDIPGETLTSALEECIDLWDNVKLAKYPTLCLLRDGGDLYFKAYDAADMKTGAVDFRKSAAGMPRPGHPETTAISLMPTSDDLSNAESKLGSFRIPAAAEPAPEVEEPSIKPYGV